VSLHTPVVTIGVKRCNERLVLRVLAVASEGHYFAILIQIEILNSNLFRGHSWQTRAAVRSHMLKHNYQLSCFHDEKLRVQRRVVFYLSRHVFVFYGSNLLRWYIGCMTAEYTSRFVLPWLMQRHWVVSESVLSLMLNLDLYCNSDDGIYIVDICRVSRQVGPKSKCVAYRVRFASSLFKNIPHGKQWPYWSV
jgi:hypothetical protein